MKNIKFKYISPPIDVIIPFHGQYHLVGECLDSIIKKTLGQIYTITLIDDASPNSNFITGLEKDKAKNIPIQFIRNSERLGFGGSINKAIEATNNPWICIIHSDCRIEQTDWLYNLLETMNRMKGDNIKLISAKLNNGGTGAYDPCVIGTREKRKDSIAEQNLPLVCFLVNRKLFEEIGNIASYFPAGYEDEEFYWRMKHHNYKQAVCGSCFVHHEGGSTLKWLMQKEPKTKRQIEENKNKFIADIRKLYGK